MENLDFLRPTESDCKTVFATAIHEAKLAAVAFIKSKTNDTAHALRYIEPLGDDAKLPHVQGMDENGRIVDVTITKIDGSQYELKFESYTIDCDALHRKVNRL